MAVSHSTQAGQDAATAMGDACVAIKTTINQVTEAVNESRSHWIGHANKAAVNTAAAWEDEADRLKGILDRITTLVGEGNKGYQKMEADNEDLFQYTTL